MLRDVNLLNSGIIFLGRCGSGNRGGEDDTSLHGRVGWVGCPHQPQLRCLERGAGARDVQHRSPTIRNSAAVPWTRRWGPSGGRAWEGRGTGWVTAVAAIGLPVVCHKMRPALRAARRPTRRAPRAGRPFLPLPAHNGQPASPRKSGSPLVARPRDADESLAPGAPPVPIVGAASHGARDSSPHGMSARAARPPPTVTKSPAHARGVVTLRGPAGGVVCPRPRGRVLVRPHTGDGAHRWRPGK